MAGFKNGSRSQKAGAKKRCLQIIVDFRRRVTVVMLDLGLLSAISYLRGSEKGLAGGVWRLAGPKIQHKMLPPNCVPLVPRGGIGKRVQKRGVESLVKEASPRANLLCSAAAY